MWNKRKEEEYPPKSSNAPAASTSQSKENPPMSTAPASSHHSPEMRGPAVIGKSVMIKGQIFSREDLTIDGEIDGSVELQEHRLTVGPHGKLQAGVKAREIVVLGTIHGNVEASDKIDIRKDAKLVGDIKTARIVIEDGAYFKGSIDIARPEISKPAAVPTPKPVVATPAPAANAAAASAPSSALSGEMKR
ncbi:MAG TPA: polymer-forming cytoskeletal protein [Bryobacteraceae bacterium]|jgi:cytoskeletal protein CcmA (bactofilin family)|nr:polymer-forming cytoskeletal protein [Bryobacteraceae bacterium]